MVAPDDEAAAAVGPASTAPSAPTDAPRAVSKRRAPNVTADTATTAASCCIRRRGFPGCTMLAAVRAEVHHAHGLALRSTTFTDSC